MQGCLSLAALRPREEETQHPRSRGHIMAGGTEHPKVDINKASESYSRFIGMTKVAMAVVAVVVVIVVLLIS